MLGQLRIAAAVAALAAAASAAWYVRGSLADAEIAAIHQAALQAQAAARDQIIRQERADHDRTTKATQAAFRRQEQVALDALAAADELRLLNDAARDFVGNAEASAAASDIRANLLAELLGSCSARYLGLAQAADRADLAARTLSEAWPRIQSLPE